MSRIRNVVVSAAGAMAGFAYYSAIGCESATCGIWGNPWLSTAAGAVLGWSILGVSSSEAAARDADSFAAGEPGLPEASSTDNHGA